MEVSSRAGRENHDLSLVFYFNGLLSYLEEISVSICLHLEASWSPVPIYGYFHVALRTCQGRGWLWMLLVVYRMGMNVALEARLGLQENPGRSGLVSCQHPHPHPTPAQPSKTVLDGHFSDLWSWFLLPGDRVGKEVRESTRHALQSELWTESVGNWHRLKLMGGVGGTRHPNHKSLLKNSHFHPLPLDVKSLLYPGLSSPWGILASVFWKVHEAFLFFKKIA